MPPELPRCETHSSVDAGQPGTVPVQRYGQKAPRCARLICFHAVIENSGWRCGGIAASHLSVVRRWASSIAHAKHAGANLAGDELPSEGASMNRTPHLAES